MSSEIRKENAPRGLLRPSHGKCARGHAIREGGQRRTADVLAGLWLSLTVSLILAVVCEMIAGLDGLGQWVLLAARSYKSADLFAGVMLLGAIGLVANSALSRAEGRLLKWRGASGR
jgi:ABC-type antimicrobial peptide transport system permease subunit